MSSLLFKNLIYIPLFSKSLVKASPCLNMARGYYSPELGFGFKEFQSFRNDLIQKQGSGYDNLKVEIRASLQEDKKLLQRNQLDSLTVMAKDEDDLKLSIEAFKKFKKDTQKPYDFNFGDKFTKTCLVLNKTKILFDAFKEEDLKTAFYGNSTISLIMNQMVIEQRYTEALKVFDDYINNMEQKLKTIGIGQYFKGKQLKQPIPFPILRLAAESLLMMNTKESFKMVNNLILIASKFNSFLNNTAICCCFLLAVRQNEFEAALEFSKRIKKDNQTLINNLRAIALASSGRLDDAHKSVVSILGIKKDPREKFAGQFFKYTIECFEKAVEKSTQTEETLEKYNKTLMEARKSERIYFNDIYEYCTSPLKNE